MIMKKSIVITALIIGLFGAVQIGGAVEPQMSTYTSLPIFTVNPVKPNILIILDNSGSMNFNAYGTYPGDGGTVNDTPYAGEPYTPALERRVAASSDDAEENLTDHNSYYTSDGGDLDLGTFSIPGDSSVVGVRFQDLEIPPGAEIVNAYIVFTAKVSLGSGAAMNLKINVEDSDNAATFTSANYDLSSRVKTSKKIHWDPAVWTANNTYQTPDISDLIQDIVNRSGWQSGNAMAFFLQYESASGEKRDAYSYNSSAANAPLLHIEYTQAANQKYYGYFNPDWFYKWDSNKFAHAYKKVGYNTVTCGGMWEVEDVIGGGGNMCLADATIATGNGNTGLWDGNWMNWAAMRRIDVARKVMMGGLATARTGGGNQTVYGEIPAQTGRKFTRQFDDASGSPVTPYSGNKWYGLKDGYIYIDTNGNGDPFSGFARYRLAIGKDETYEPEDFYEGNVSGVLQKVGDKAWWGNEFFYFGEGNNREGGYIANAVGTNMTTLVTDLQNTSADTWTPLAEAYYVATQYFKQEKPQTGLGYHNSAIGSTNNTMDPFYQDGEFIPCAKNFVILLTDGASTEDENIPDSLKDYDGDGNDPGVFDNNGSDYLDDVALYARTTDLRADLDGEQTIILYPIYAFGNENNARDLLRDAARNGGFNDKNGNNQPDGTYSDPAADRLEWDTDGDGTPDTYFEAQDGYLLEAKLLEAINDILKRAASGTAVSVLATSSEGEGNVIQAYFRPTVTSGITETKWVGYLQSLWVDSLGYLREDTNGNAALDLDTDKVLVYFIDANGNTRVNKYAVSSGDEYPDLENDTPVEVGMSEILPIWEAGSLLAERDPDGMAGSGPRELFTYIEGATPDLYGGVSFVKANSATIQPYLGVKDNTAWSYLGATHSERAENLIHFIRGNDSGFSGTPDMRTRNIEVNGIDLVWKLGDIVHSTPVSIALPPDNYGLIYSDESYQGYYTTRKTLASRETMVYVGANDGMLHAFTSWQYDSATKTFSNPSGNAFEEIGAELWAYIPRALLPHLKWLPSDDYTHVYYVDQKPKIVDAKIFYNTLGDAGSGLNSLDTLHVNGWGTVLIGGLRMGGKDINVTDDFDYNTGTADTTKTFSSSYFAIDITDPRNPTFLWEKSYNGLQFTTNEPAVLKVDTKWYVVFGSGPSDYDGTSGEKGKIFVVDLATGTPYQNGTNDWLFQTAENDAFMAGAATLDKELNYNVDAIYIGQANEAAGHNWEGDMYKVVIPWRCIAADCTSVLYGNLTDGEYVIDPNDASDPWYLTKLYDTDRPITAPPALSVDFADNTWVYFGTGRYMSQGDKTNTDEQYLFGIKDPFFNREHTTTGTFTDNYYHNYSASLTLDQSDLLDGDIFKVIYPWGTYDLPAGDCSAVPTGQVGDIYVSTDPGACVCSYDWPIALCTEATAGHCTSMGVTLGAEIEPGQYAGDQVFDDGDCVCIPYEVPSWGCLEYVVGACDHVGSGVVSNNPAYHSLYWDCTGANDDSCLSVAFGTIGSGLGDGTCTCFEVTPPPWSCDQRLAGNCSTVSPAPTFGDEGDLTDAGGGLCRVGYWACYPTDEVNDPDACARTGHAVDYTLTTGFLGAASDGDYFGDGSCLCSFVTDPVAVVVNTTSNFGLTFEDLIALARQKDGWFRTLPDPGERSLTKPALLGGLSLFTTYVPSAETCEFGGYSYLWALYYETGTAFKDIVFDEGTVVKEGVLCLIERYGLGRGLASSVGIHVGKQEGGKAKGFVQLSTGVIVEIPIDPAFNIRSGLRYWREN